MTVKRTPLIQNALAGPAVSKNEPLPASPAATLAEAFGIPVKRLNGSEFSWTFQIDRNTPVPLPQWRVGTFNALGNGDRGLVPEDSLDFAAIEKSIGNYRVSLLYSAAEDVFKYLTAAEQKHMDISSNEHKRKDFYYFSRSRTGNLGILVLPPDRQSLYMHPHIRTDRSISWVFLFPVLHNCKLNMRLDGSTTCERCTPWTAT